MSFFLLREICVDMSQVLWSQHTQSTIVYCICNIQLDLVFMHFAVVAQSFSRFCYSDGAAAAFKASQSGVALTPGFQRRVLAQDRRQYVFMDNPQNHLKQRCFLQVLALWRHQESESHDLWNMVKHHDFPLSQVKLKYSSCCVAPLVSSAA